MNAITDSGDTNSVNENVLEKAFLHYAEKSFLEQVSRDISVTDMDKEVSLYIASLKDDEVLDEIVLGSSQYYKNQLYVLAQNAVTCSQVIPRVAKVLQSTECELYQKYYIEPQVVDLESRGVTKELLLLVQFAIEDVEFLSVLNRINTSLGDTGLSTSGSYDLTKIKQLINHVLAYAC
ncbi:hypothetical protein [Vibrio owensii]|uniref:hypothetical protein n=1 Tax=Vibrio harveyi group TaxID=717610 RepID=UPI003CC590F3